MIRTTRPLVLPGAGVLVEDLVVTFAGGRIVDATASTGIEAVRPSSTATTARAASARCPWSRARPGFARPA